ncbi:MAG: 5-formyltetrahydrofolate cyclo-ligase [bacterium]
MKLRTLIPKSEARKLVVQRRMEHPETELKTKTKRIIERLSQTDDFIFAKTIHCYIASRPGEVDTRALIDFMVNYGKVVIIPKLNKLKKEFRRCQFLDWEHITRNSEGYLEPQYGMDEDMSDIDLVLVPSLAVSLSGHRVGYGGGYYDKLLKQTFAPKIVLAFEFQIFDYIESNVHDTRIDKIITERRIINIQDRIIGY